jgi:acetylornithine deacetylase
VDLATQVRLTRELVDIDSTSGREGEAGALIVRTLKSLGYRVVEQPVTPGRFNVIATLVDAPSVVFSTHYDCVPPFFPSGEERGFLVGRGVSDAKGILVAQIAAAERLRARGNTSVGLLFVVGEEWGSDGAKLANTIAPGSKYLINGEPTDNRLARATRGIYRAVVRTIGRAAHTSQPELGESAIEKLIDVLVGLRSVSWPTDPDLGATYYTVGVISGGIAPNVVPPNAEAEVLFRTVGDFQDVSAILRARLPPGCSVEDAHVVPAERLTVVPGFDTAVFNFATDAPFLNNWGRRLLLGPGSIQVAHTSDERVEVAELARAVDLYVTLVNRL